jgi:hypothetical protein
MVFTLLPRPPAACVATLLLGLAVTACAHDYDVENRDTPVHVWLSAPDLGPEGGRVNALIYVGSEKAVEGPVRFPPGVAHVKLPTLFMTTGDKTVSAVIQGGALSATDEVEIEGESWVQVVVRRGSVEIVFREEEPAPGDF